MGTVPVCYYSCMTVLMLIVAGLLLGSFVNALVWRLHEKRDWVTERSECPLCHHVLAPKDLVPVLSWLWLRGKCRYCKARIPDTPLTELAVPLLFVISYYWWPVALQGRGLFDFIFWLIFIVGFVALSLFDLRWFLLPNNIVFPLMALAVLQVAGDWLLFGGSWHTAVGPALGVLFISGLFYVLHRVSQGKWIGFGDVKLGVVLGLLAASASKAALLLLVASLVGTLVALPLVIAGKAHRKSLLPFGPLLIAGMIFVELWGAKVVAWYTSLVI